MSSWSAVAAAAPEFAARVQALFDSGTNKTIATLRRDGSPRISGTELSFADGEITLGMMAGARKIDDVVRDPRVAIHSPTLEPPKDDPTAWPGEAKVSGRLVAITPPDDRHVGASFFRLDVSEAALTRVGEPGDHLVIESWSERRGYRRRSRA